MRTFCKGFIKTSGRFCDNYTGDGSITCEALCRLGGSKVLGVRKESEILLDQDKKTENVPTENIEITPIAAPEIDLENVKAARRKDKKNKPVEIDTTTWEPSTISADYALVGGEVVDLKDPIPDEDDGKPKKKKSKRKK